MKFINCFALFICLFLYACGGNDNDQLSRLESDSIILAFGDSLTHGTGAKQNESYPAILEQLTGRKVINAGIPGEISEKGLMRLPELLEKHHPDLLILCHGGNDILRKQDVKKMGSNIEVMIKLAQSQNIPVILLGVPQFGIFLSPAEIYSEIADKTGVIYIGDLVSDILGDNSLKSDTVHPNKDGYRKMAEQIYIVMQKAGAI